MYDQYNADLADYIGYSNANDGYRYLLFIIDVFSRYLWVEPIKNTADRSIVEAFRPGEENPDVSRLTEERDSQGIFQRTILNPLMWNILCHIIRK